MGLPKPRNLIIGVVIGLLVVAGGLLIAQDQETLRVRTELPAADPRFPDYLARLLGAPVTNGDSYIVHTDGTAAFPAMLEAINSAKHRISFETYVYQSGEIGSQFNAALEAAARRGVDVRMVLDSIGASKTSEEDLERLRSAGVKIAFFNQVSGVNFEEVNYRTHRKSLVADGDIAFVGGIGVADQGAIDTEQEKMWRDTQIEVRGPAAVYVEGSFNENWIESGEVVAPDLVAHDDEPTGPAKSIVVWSGPEGGASAMKLLYLLAIASARQTLDIESPYFVMDESTRWSIEDARRRGVKVRMVVEGDITDAKPVKFASRAAYERLLEQGVLLHEYQPSMMHAKVMVVDGLLSIFGSANFDNRSLELNDELNIAAFDPTLAARLTADFERDIARSKALKLDEWRSRPFHIRAREVGWSYFGEVF